MKETHGDFNDYCVERWRITRQHADRQIAAVKIAERLEPLGAIP